MPRFLIVLGIVCCLYGAAMGALYPAGLFFLAWLVIGAALVACGWAMRNGSWQRLPLAVRRVAAALGIAMAAGIATLSGVIVSGAVEQPSGRVDYLIVLGASINQDGSPMETLRQRLDAAADYLDAHPDTRCIVSGGQGDDEPMAEAAAMARYLERRRGIAPERIIEEARSATTVENLRNSRALIEPADASVAVVTNDFHMFRALRMARRQGFARVSGVTAPTNPLYLPQATLRECGAIVKALATGAL